MSETVTGPDAKSRCRWCGAAPEFLDYHDREWGYPVDEDRRLFEKICLESFQAGLSWRTILNKRENFRQAFCHFDYKKIARFKEKDVERLLNDEGIVRHRGKIEAVINNARRALEMIKTEGSLAAFFWSYEPGKEDLSKPQSLSASETAQTLSSALKKRGWKFVGPTTVYAFMQAMGLINDHVEACVIRNQVEQARKKIYTTRIKKTKSLNARRVLSDLFKGYCFLTRSLFSLLAPRFFVGRQTNVYCVKTRQIYFAIEIILTF